MSHHDEASHAEDSHADSQLQTDLLALARSVSRRDALFLLGGAGTGLVMNGCGGGSAGGVAAVMSSASSSSASSATSSASSSSTSSSSSSKSSSSTSSGSTTCSLIPEETAGPYPGDGSNSNSSGVVNALLLSGIVRSDIRSSIAGASGVASGVPLTITLELVTTLNSCKPLAGYAIYLWHCDAAGRYSLYSTGVTGENYLRGVQVTDASGFVSFTTIVPGCYSGRMPHMHFEVYPSLATATGSSNKIRTSQIAFPTSVMNTVYAQSAYSGSASNLSQISFATDNIFSDGYSTQLASMSGSVAAGYTASLQVGIAV
ncbi:MAG: intradiol ring-cleavage dioxygenase [Rhodocyclaceae bacterium]